MRSVFRYEISVTDRPVIRMPAGAVVLDVLSRGELGVAHMWAVVDTGRPERDREFIIVGTGHQLPKDVGEWIATWQDGPLVWHMFEVEDL